MTWFEALSELEFEYAPKTDMRIEPQETSILADPFIEYDGQLDDAFNQSRARMLAQQEPCASRLEECLYEPFANESIPSPPYMRTSHCYAHSMMNRKIVTVAPMACQGEFLNECEQRQSIPLTQEFLDLCDLEDEDLCMEPFEEVELLDLYESVIM